MRDYRFGNFLQELRERRGFSQYQLGALVGVSAQAVSKWENGTAKPQPGSLYRLSEVLEITVDELLACRYRIPEQEQKEGLAAMKYTLWKKAHQEERNRYGEQMPVEVLNRYLSESYELRNTDWILFFDLLGQIAAQAKARREHVLVRGTLGASLTAYVLGTTEVNPLPPHWYCPRCKKIEFAEGASCGWDLPAKFCSCGVPFLRDGHDLPFESVRNGFSAPYVPHVNLSIPQSIRQTVRESILSYFTEGTVVVLTEKDRPQLETYVLLKEKTAEFTNGQELPRGEFYDRLRRFPSITVLTDEALDAYRRLEEQTGVPFDDVPFAAAEVLEAFQREDTQGIPEFRTDFFKDMTDVAAPASFHDLIQMTGLAHGTGVWTDNAEKWIREGMPVGRVITYREDVFRYVQERMTAKNLPNTGFAYQVMMDTCRGVYAKGGMSELLLHTLSEIGAEAWFIESIEKIGYAFPKAHAILYVKYAAILMWYKLHHPEAFASILLKK